MKFHPQVIVKKVRNKRVQGLSIKKLSELFEIPATTISRWVRHIESGNTMFKRAREKELRFKEELCYMIDDSLLKNPPYPIIFLSLMYWCEGSKYPSTNYVTFTNSDPRLVATFVTLLRKGFELDEKKFRCHLQIHSDHDKKTIVAYWSKLLKIPESSFYKPTITTPKNRMKRLDYIGTCTVKYYDVTLLLKITGLYERFSWHMERWPRG